MKGRPVRPQTRIFGRTRLIEGSERAGPEATELRRTGALPPLEPGDDVGMSAPNQPTPQWAQM